jgi:hypothetical protein
LRATRRRQRKIDSLASTVAVLRVFQKLRSALPDIIPASDNELTRMLRAVRHVQRHPATDTRRGRPSPWKREDLLRVTSNLAAVLERETSAQISLASFIDHYLGILKFPADVTDALASGQINLFEAEQLARISHKRLACSPEHARRVRQELLLSHSKTRAPGDSLRKRVNEILIVESVGDREGPSSSAEVNEIDLEDFDPYDSTHLFWEQIKQLGFAFRDIRREDVTEDEVQELLEASEPIIAVLNRIQKRTMNKVARKLSV